MLSAFSSLLEGADPEGPLSKQEAGQEVSCGGDMTTSTLPPRKPSCSDVASFQFALPQGAMVSHIHQMPLGQGSNGGNPSWRWFLELCSGPPG